jgi:hypothetical protein
VPVVPVKPPDDLFAKVAERVRSLPETGTHFLADVPHSGLALVAPHRVFTLSLDAIRDGQFDRAVFAGWRLLLVAEDRVVGAAEVDESGEYATVDGSRFAQATGTTLDELDDLPELGDGGYEFRLLKVNPLYMAAAWLVGGNSVVVPLEPAPAFLQAGRAYAERDFLDAFAQPGVKPFGGEPIVASLKEGA